MKPRVLVARLDSAGDVLLAGPAIRAIAAGASDVTLLIGPRGAAAAGLLPGPNRIEVWDCPWISADPQPVRPTQLSTLVAGWRALRLDAAVLLTSFHQSPLPLALLLRMAGVRRIAGISPDYPGVLLDCRHHVVEDIPESQRGLSLAAAAGFRLPAGDDGRLRVRGPLPDVRELTGAAPYVVAHPGASVPARRWPVNRWAEAVRLLRREGWRVLVTGSAGERDLTAVAAEAGGSDLAGRTSLAELAGVLAGAAAVVVGNTGPAHLAAAVDTPVVSLFAPVVSGSKWLPYGVPSVALGDQHAPCRDTRARECPVPGHPCLSSVTATDVGAAVRTLTGGCALPEGAGR